MSDRVPPTDRAFAVIIRPKHFENAVTENANKCVIAQALRATFPDMDDEDIIVGTKDFRLSSDPLTDDLGKPNPDNPRWFHDGRAIVRGFDQGCLGPEQARHGLTVTFTPAR